MSVETRSTVKVKGVFTSTALASKIPFTLQVRLKGPMPWEEQVRLMEVPSTTGSGAPGVMNGTGAGLGRGGKEGEAILWVGGECNVKITEIKMLHVRAQKPLVPMPQRDKEVKHLIQALSTNGYPNGLVE